MILFNCSFISFTGILHDTSRCVILMKQMVFYDQFDIFYGSYCIVDQTKALDV